MRTATKETRLKMSRSQFLRQGGEVKKKTKAGYVLLFMPEHPNSNSGGRIFEHRLVMENKVGRLLLRSEIVHHLNGVKDDNRPENLYLVSSHAEHRAKEVRGLDCPHCGGVINGVRLN